ncbi:MAG: hypothetical protein AAGC73_04560 [Verrucomicrobiota bacterium]
MSNALSKEDFQKMSPAKRFFLKLHVKLCVVCGKFNRQVIETQDMCSYYKKQDAAAELIRPTLDLEKKDELKKLLAEQPSQSQH